jgi:pimeloyl-ACP methyl ester carboxylesterase
MNRKICALFFITIFYMNLFLYPKSKEMKNGDEKIIRFDSLELCSESFGNSENPPILLIMGAAASMIWWDAEFCQKLADQGRFVIRYDNRDVGRSTTYEPGRPDYTIEDMADDAVRILNYYKIEKAHFVGMSLGGMISQLVVLRKPERVLTMTLISSSVWDDLPELPGIEDKILNYHSSASSVNWSERDSVINYMVGGWKLLNGSKWDFDENRSIELAETEYERANNLSSMFNHSLLKGGELLYGKSKEINIPTLIIHGTEDPVLPYEHGIALKNTIPNSELLTLEGRGHEIHYNDWENIIESIVKHTEQ